MIRVWRCRICGDSYLGEEPPTDCPFCGAAKSYIILAKGWTDQNPIKGITETDRKNLEETLQLEIGATQFYECAAKVADNPEDQAMFKALMKIEREHAVLATKALNVPRPIIGGGKCEHRNNENLLVALKDEEHAAERYAKFAAEAKSPRAREIFKALTEVENDHAELIKPKIK